MVQKININKYVADVKKNLCIEAPDEIVEKDLLLTLILAEFEKRKLEKELIFKGGTLLSRNYLNYHRFSEDLDFVHKDSNKLRELKRNTREKRIKQFIDYFVPELKEVANILNLEFSTDRSNTRFCTILHGRVIYIFRIYYSENNFIKIEINFVEKIIHPPKRVSIKAITDFFDSRELLFTLGLKIENFVVMSYTLEEIVLEKYRAILTRSELKERDLFDLFLIKNIFNPNINQIVEKIKCSSLIRRNLNIMIKEKLLLLEKNEFFRSDEKIEYLTIIQYNKIDFENLKEKIKPILIEICKKFLEMY
ncbi:nucleotidyl transferase AbiEii/AbiGii toxin family protein [Candidatus Woesearchaeota archaeon]|nr:nucleotidyl transferase AbiEii/AbiGii toxin family protein [Candidatus Woesearchaeota archaeon]